MRIALVVHGFPPHERTGVETHVAALAAVLGRKGVEVEVFAPRADPRAPQFAQRREQRDSYSVTWIAVHRTPQTAEEHLVVPGMAAAFGEFLERTRPALVHFHHVLKLGIGVIEETARRGIPAIYTAHDYFPVCHRVILARPDLERCSTIGDSSLCARCDNATSYLDAKNRWSDYQAGVLADSLSSVEQRELAAILGGGSILPDVLTAVEVRSELDRRRKQAFSTLDLVLAPTEFLREQLIAGGFDPSRVMKSEYGIETEALAALPPPRAVASRPLTFGFIGGVHKHKGLHVLLEAFAPLISEARLVIHADSTDREYVDELRVRAHELGADWRGAFSAQELPRVLSAIDVLAVPSIWWENAPFVIREAFAARRPVIASDTAALRESVRDGVDGLLVAPGNVSAWTAAMRSLVEDPARFAELATHVRAPRTLEDQCLELIEQYSALAGPKQQQARLRSSIPAHVPASARDFAGRVAELEGCSVAELVQRASAGLATLARSLGVDEKLAQPADTRAIALEHLQDARREIAWRVGREGHHIAELERERELRMGQASELQRAQADGENARKALSRATIELAARAQLLDAAERAQAAARETLAQEQQAHEAARSALAAAKQALEEAGSYCAQFAAQLAEISAAREELARQLSQSRSMVAQLERSHSDLAQGFTKLLAHTQWLEQESASLARRFGHQALALHSGTDFSAARAAVDLFERELAWRRREMQAARDEGGRIWRMLVERSGLGRRMRGWEDEASTPVSIVIPALGEFALLEAGLRSLLREIERRKCEDEIIVVDDGGDGKISAWVREQFPGARTIVHVENLGFARSLSAGVKAARHEFVFAMNSDVCVRRGFLEPLLEVLADERVFAAVPRILLRGQAQQVESLVAVRLEGGVARAAQPALEQRGAVALSEERLRGTCPVPFPIGGACLMRRSQFQALGGFDPAFEPFYLEDLDLGWRAWKAGFSCRYVGASIVEHQHRGTIGALVPEPVVLTAIERNRLLFTWKHLDDPHLLDEHIRELSRRVAEAGVTEERTFLGALCLALEDREHAAAEAPPSSRSESPSFLRIQAASDPFRPV